jgi:hypothetical protein
LRDVTRLEDIKVEQKKPSLFPKNT